MNKINSLIDRQHGGAVALLPELDSTIWLGCFYEFLCSLRDAWILQLPPTVYRNAISGVRSDM